MPSAARVAPWRPGRPVALGGGWSGRQIPGPAADHAEVAALGPSASKGLSSDNGAVHAPLYLVRHGESEWNARDLIQGQTAHPGLTAAGREQAWLAGERIRRDLAAQQLAVGGITTSDLARATQTAGILAEVLGGRVRADVRWREQHLGDLQGMTKAQARQRAGPHGPGIDAGESDGALRQRMAAAFEDLDPSAVQIVVSHRRALRQLTAHLLGLADGEQIRIPNGAAARWRAGDLHWLP